MKAHTMNYVDSLFKRANSLLIADKNEDAIRCFDECVKLHPNDDKMWNNRAVVLDHLGRHKEALSSYDNAIKLNPFESPFYYNRGHTLEEMGRFDDALIWYNKALEIKPNDKHYIKLKTNLLKRTK